MNNKKPESKDSGFCVLCVNYSAYFLFNQMCRINPTIIKRTELPKTALLLIAELPEKKMAIKMMAEIIINSRPKFFSKLFILYGI